MPPTPVLPELHTPGAARRRWRPTLPADPGGAVGAGDGAALVRVTVPWPSHASLLATLKTSGGSRVRWAAPRGATPEPGALACLEAAGAVQEATWWGDARFEQASGFVSGLCEQLQGDAGVDALPVAFTAFGFRSASVEGPEGSLWRGAPDAWAWSPRWIVTRTVSGAATLVASAMVAPHASPAAVTRRLRDAAERLAARAVPGGEAALARPLAAPFAGTDGEREAWLQRVWEARDAICQGTLDKVVLARAAEAHAPQGTRFDAAATFEALATRNPSCTAFALTGPAAGVTADGRPATFLGATPEPLVRVRRDLVETVALAGTLPRDAADRHGAASLARSAKDQEEHALVIQGLEEALRGLVDGLSHPPEPRLRRLRDVVHLETPVTARRLGGVHLLDLAQRLHPTPAMGGSPRLAARRWLEDHEPWHRGLYAAPLGWVDGRGGGELVVGIRSARVGARVAHGFAGGGIVAASDPESEWRETVAKLQAVGRALRVVPVAPEPTR